ncbi:MAG: T9SS type A sorting domain-containing protein [Calditrichaeota bacterium]|nr:T9SS type A sorting domain-containing protein [Calditrichota bacterium]
MIKKIIPGLVVCLMLLFVVSAALAVEGTPSGKTLNKNLTIRAVKYIDVNQIRSSVMNNGTFTRHPITGNADMEWPKGSGKYICYNAGIWIAGKINGDIRTACADYNVEYQPGKILPDGTADDPSKEEYRVYKVHKDYPDGDAALEIDSWDTWRTFAEQQGAPAVADADNNWIGLGDEMLYAVMNDLDQNLHNGCYNTLPIGIELHLIVFGFDRAGSLGNTIFIKYIVINKGQNDLQEAYIGAWADVDNGDANDDLIGYDLDTGMSYCYGGKPIDSTYGPKPPALGWDYFQGPIVDSPGDSVQLPDGTVYHDKKMIGATSFNKYYNGNATYSDPPYSAQGALEVWNYLSGTQKDGTPWVNPVTGEVTTFSNTGDPVTGTGWLSTMENPPDDIRMLTGSGPFTLSVGDTQNIVLGCVIAQGNNRLSSVSKLRFYDKLVQQAYDLNFSIPSPPLAPNVVVTEDDRSVLVTWNNDDEDYVQKGYQFEGYNVYIGSSAGGPWKRLATYDENDGILVVKDETYDDNSGVTVELPSAFGEDKGLKYYYRYTKDYEDLPMANGRNYYVAVTSYAVGLESVPRILESSKNVLTVTPHKPPLGTVVNQDFGQTIPVEHYQGAADTSKYEIWVQVWDPLHVETADYEVDFNPDSSWTLLKNGQAVEGYTNVTNYGVDKQLSEKTSIYDSPIDFFIGVDADFVANDVLTWVPKLVADAGPVNPGLVDSLSHPYLKLKYKNDMAKFGTFKKGTSDPSILYNKLEIRFTGVMDSTTMEVVSGGSMSTLEFSFGDASHFIPEHPKNPNPGSRDPFLLRVPFEVWDMDRNIQLNTGFADFKQKISDSTFVPTWTPEGDCIIYVLGSEYDEQVHNISYTGQDTMATWMFTYRPGMTWSTGDIVELSFPAIYPVTGKEVTVHMKGQDITLTPDKFKFSIKGPETGVLSDVKQRLDLINVYPNPYFAHTISEKALHQEHVTFINLPEQCTIRIFTISGQLVRKIEHNDPNSTVHNWDLRNANNLPVASGFYIAYIEIPNVGTKILKMAVIFREQRLKNL